MRIVLLLAACLLAGVVRAEESKNEIFNRWLEAIVPGAPESGLKAMAEFKSSKSFDGVVDYEARVQEMSCRASVEDGKVRGSQILAFKDKFPEEATRKKVEALCGITFPEPKNFMGGRNYRFAKDGRLITLGFGGPGGGTTFDAGVDPMAQPKDSPDQDTTRIDYLGMWLGKVVPSGEPKPAADGRTTGTPAKGKVTMVLVLAPKNEGHVVVFAPDRKLDPTGEKGLTSGHMLRGTWEFKSGVVTLTPDPEDYPSSEYPNLKPLELAATKPAEDKMTLSLGDFANSGLPLSKGDFKFTLHRASEKENAAYIEKIENGNVVPLVPQPVK